MRRMLTVIAIAAIVAAVLGLTCWQRSEQTPAAPELVSHRFSTPPIELPMPAQGTALPAKQVSFTWKQPQVEKLPAAPQIEEMLANGSAHLLESQLTDAHRLLLQEKVQDLTRALMQLALRDEEELTRIKGLLVGDAERTIEITAKKRDEDPNYPRLLRMRELVERGHGGVWGDFIDGREIHFVVRWDEWPALKSIRDMQLKLIAQRTQIVADSIEAGYRREGSAVFRSK